MNGFRVLPMCVPDGWSARLPAQATGSRTAAQEQQHTARPAANASSTSYGLVVNGATGWAVKPMNSVPEVKPAAKERFRTLAMPKWE